MIKQIKWKDHPILGDLELDFTKEDGSIYNTIVFAGENGTGKTTILENLSEFLNLGALEYIDYINELAKDKEYRLVLLVITDIIRNGSYLLYTDGSSEIIADSFNFMEIEQGYYVDGVVSRKKQIVPAVMDSIR